MEVIAIKSELDIVSKKVNLSCNAEVLSVELTLSNKTKICISTVYRVGTLGTQNFTILENYFNNLLCIKKYSKLFIVGDFNLPNIKASNWDSGHSDHPLEQMFLDLFSNKGLVQKIKDETHYKGNILDILLTNSPQCIENVHIEPENKICNYV